MHHQDWVENRRMAELKTTPNSASVKQFIDSIDDDRRRADSRRLLAMMREITGEKPKMWGLSIVGFGNYHYKYASPSFAIRTRKRLFLRVSQP